MTTTVVVSTTADWPDLQNDPELEGYSLSDGIPLSANGQWPETHRGTHAWSPNADDRARISRAAANNSPRVISKDPVIIVDGEEKAIFALEHFLWVLDNEGLMRIEESDEFISVRRLFSIGANEDLRKALALLGITTTEKLLEEISRHYYDGHHDPVLTLEQLLRIASKIDLGGRQ